jgi:HD-GYP domain-containing protein (c-di-GMP phosphodiesterase class II)
LTRSPRRLPQGRILYSLLGLLLAVGVVPLLWTSSTLIRQSREILELDEKIMQADKARSLSQQVALYLQSIESQVTAIARTIEIEAGQGPFVARIARIRDSTALARFVGGESSLIFYYIGVVDTACAGTGVGLAIKEPKLLGLLQEGCYRGGEGKKLLPNYPVMLSVDPPNREPVTVIGVPVFDGRGHAVGTVLAVASLRPLWRMTRQAGIGGKEVYIVDGRGQLVAHSDESRLKGSLDVSRIEIVRQLLESTEHALSTVPFTLDESTGKTRMLGTYTRIPDEAGWGVVVQVREAEAYRVVNKARQRATALVAVVTVLAAVLGLLFAGQISRPIRQLAWGARQLAGGDYSTRVSVRSGNEVGILADAFNLMGEEIEKAIEQIRRAAETNRQLFVGSIRMLANAIDEKDPYTRGHSDRVAYYSRMIAKHMGLSAEEVERVYLAGILHDVGKIGIEDKILRKASALTDDEYQIMKQHTRKGEYILAAVPTLKALTGDGLKHHENFDGTGYPDGIKGTEIPLVGRIICVADAFDAMTTDRPYSKAWTFEAALSRLRVLAGTKFDPSCVGAMESAAAAGDLDSAKIPRSSAPVVEPVASVATVQVAGITS